jgi:hypothetical protein
MTEASDFSNVDRELDDTILSFADIQAELNLRHAKDALRDIVENLDLTVQERTGLEPEIGGLGENARQARARLRANSCVWDGGKGKIFGFERAARSKCV